MKSFARPVVETLCVPNAVYMNIINRIIDDLNPDSMYWTGSVSMECAGVEYEFNASIIIYRNREDLPEGTTYPIESFVPVWYELNAYRENEEAPIDTNFDFRKLNQFL